MTIRPTPKMMAVITAVMNDLTEARDAEELRCMSVALAALADGFEQTVLALQTQDKGDHERAMLIASRTLSHMLAIPGQVDRARESYQQHHSSSLRN